jgi:hypothetical protein
VVPGTSDPALVLHSYDRHFTAPSTSHKTNPVRYAGSQEYFSEDEPPHTAHCLQMPPADAGRGVSFRRSTAVRQSSSIHGRRFRCQKQAVARRLIGVKCGVEREREQEREKHRGSQKIIYQNSQQIVLLSAEFQLLDMGPSGDHVHIRISEEHNIRSNHLHNDHRFRPSQQVWQKRPAPWNWPALNDTSQYPQHGINEVCGLDYTSAPPSY